MGRTAARAHMAHLQGHTRKAPLTTNVPHPAFLPPRTGWSNKEEALTSPAQKGYARIGSTLRRPGAEFLHRYFEFYPQDGLSPSKELSDANQLALDLKSEENEARVLQPSQTPKSKLPKPAAPAKAPAANFNRHAVKILPSATQSVRIPFTPKNLADVLAHRGIDFDDPKHECNRGGTLPLVVFDDFEYNIGKPAIVVPTSENGLHRPAEGLGLWYDPMGRGIWKACNVFEFRPLEQKFTVHARTAAHAALTRSFRREREL